MFASVAVATFWKPDWDHKDDKKDNKGVAPKTTLCNTKVSTSTYIADEPKTYTKIFVGGLAWETKRDTLRHFFEQFGEILEAVVIHDKNSERSKGF